MARLKKNLGPFQRFLKDAIGKPPALYSRNPLKCPCILIQTKELKND